ncbi:hypothetical protein N0V90_009119 [Kalmusia sp. IMI 367209]|nr:hypothetical protein N0V90_009119 [Kalmusia sp. IMI 367209]
MSVVSNFTPGTAEEATTLRLFAIYLGKWNMFQAHSQYRGQFFSVTLVPRKTLLSATNAKLGHDFLTSKLYALKTPRLIEDHSSPRNSTLFRSISKEYQVLKCESLKHHANVVTLFGCCWQSLDVYAGLPIPSLILEGTKLGDLANFSCTRDLTLRERLRICMHVTSGLKAIHAVGIVHGDIKLENILIFHQASQSYIAKIADFGSSMLLAETKLPSVRPPGTPLYMAPECADSAMRFSREELLKTDIFSLGIVLAVLLLGMRVLEEMAKMGSRLIVLKEDGQFIDWLTRCADEDCEELFDLDGCQSIGPGSLWETDHDWSVNSVRADEELWALLLDLLAGSLAANSLGRFGSADDILPLLRKMTRLQLNRTLKLPDILQNGSAKCGSPQWLSGMSAALGLPMSKLTKATGLHIESPMKLSREELEAIVFSCLPMVNLGDLIRQSRFVRKFNAKANLRYPTSRNWRSISRYPLKSQLKSGASKYKVDIYMVNLMIGYLIAWIHEGETKPVELHTTGAINKIHKISEKSILSSLMPPPVKALLEAQLLREASSKLKSEAWRADAAFEYAVMIINSEEISPSRLSEAIEFLGQSAKMGHVGARSTFGILHDAFEYPLPVSRELEIEWVLAACHLGSMTAQKRLQSLDSPNYEQIMKRIRHDHGGFSPITNRILREYWDHECGSGNPYLEIACYIHYVASTGDIDSLSTLLIPLEELYDYPNVLGETPLVVACRGGHQEVASFLLEYGSDPTLTTIDGVSALHFLSAFEDKNIPKMALQLLEHGADIEKPCLEAPIYKELFDSPFGVLDGTPLLWATVARNHCAVKELVNRGADPLNTGCLQSSTVGEPKFESSPMRYAAMFHLVDMIEIFLSSAKTDTERLRLRKRLNSTFERSGDKRYETALRVAIDCNTGFRFQEYLIHGASSWEAARRSVQLLVEFGADPMILDRHPQKSVHPILYACFSGNLLTIEYLWNYRNGSLRPKPQLWFTALQTAISNHNHSVFDFLIRHRKDVAPDSEIDRMTVSNIMTITEDRHFVMGSLELVPKPSSAENLELIYEQFLCALHTCQFEAARALFQQGRFNLASQIGGGTILGFLISLSGNHPNIEQKVSFILSLTPEIDDLFWRVGYVGGCGLTALQAVVWRGGRNGSMDLGVFDRVLKQFSDRRYLDARVEGALQHRFSGYSALHLATYCSNMEAVTLLLSSGADRNALSSHGESPPDICIDMAEESTMKAAILKMGQQGLRAGTEATIGTEDISKKLSILYKLLSEGARLSRYFVFLRRSSQDHFDIVHREFGPIRTIRLLDKLNATNRKISDSSRTLILQIPIGGLAAFSDSSRETDNALPSDLKRFFACLWKRPALEVE